MTPSLMMDSRMEHPFSVLSHIYIYIYIYIYKNFIRYPFSCALLNMKWLVTVFQITVAYTKDLNEHIFVLNSVYLFVLYPGIL